MEVAVNFESEIDALKHARDILDVASTIRNTHLRGSLIYVAEQIGSCIKSEEKDNSIAYDVVAGMSALRDAIQENTRVVQAGFSSVLQINGG